MANRADSPVPGAPLRQRPVSAPSSDRTHLGTATVAQTGPDASRRVGMSRIGNTPTCRIPFGEIPMHRDQSALQASLDPYRWQCQDAPLCEFGNVRVGRHLVRAELEVHAPTEPHGPGSVELTGQAVPVVRPELGRIHFLEVRSAGGQDGPGIRRQERRVTYPFLARGRLAFGY